MTLLFSIDARYYHQLRAVLTSVLVHHERVPLDVHVLHLDLRPAQIDTIRQDFNRPNLTLTFHEFNPPLNADELLYRSGHIQSLSTFSRVFMGDILPDSVEKVLYLDCDIVVRGDLTELWNTSFDGNVVMAARDISSEVANYTIASFPEMAGKERLPYFNAGVLFVDLRRFRELKIKDTCLDLIRRYGPQLKCYDQDVLNIALSGRWKQMSWRWNCLAPLTFLGNSAMHRAIAAPSTYADPRIVHFIYKFKPWQAAYAGPYREEFLQHYGGTIEGDVSKPLKRRIEWDLYEFSTGLHYFKVGALRSGPDMKHLRLLTGQLLRKPWLIPIVGCLGIYYRFKGQP